MTWLDDLTNFMSRSRTGPINVLYRIELPDGEILGVIEHKGQLKYAMFNHTYGRWSTSLTKRQRAIIAHDWEIEQGKAGAQG